MTHHTFQAAVGFGCFFFATLGVIHIAKGIRRDESPVGQVFAVLFFAALAGAFIQLAFAP